MQIEYDSTIYKQIVNCIRWRDTAALDVLIESNQGLLECLLPNWAINRSDVEAYILYPTDHTLGVPDYTHQHHKNITMLMVAASIGQESVVAYLLGKGANINAEDTIGLTPLAYAILSQNESVAKLLLKNGIAVNTATHKAKTSSYTEYSSFETGNSFTKFGVTPLHLAAKLCSWNMVQTLLAYKADYNAMDANRHSILDYGISNMDKKVAIELRKLIEAFPTPKLPGDALKLLEVHIHSSVKEAKYQESLIKLAKEDDYGDLFNNRELAFWNYACSAKCFAAFQLLVDEGAFNLDALIKKSGNDVFYGAVRSRAWDFASLAIESGYPLSIRDLKGALNHLPLVEKILQAGVSPVPQNKKDWLHDPVNALISQDLEPESAAATMEVLLSHGASAEADDIGRLPLIQAVEANRLHVLKVLLKWIKNVNQADRAGTTALMAASALGNDEAVTILLESGSDINLQNLQGQTALFLAVKNSHVTTVKILLEGAGNKNIPNKFGETPLQLAQQRKNKQLIELLNF
ncbi:MAG: ankyrin repeat domain-containing protein [Candidatus Riflebacteria bacterium]|nr:ankyrin repeat domain-containing protein [Candidatus Riflebacteria bacterium]